MFTYLGLDGVMLICALLLVIRVRVRLGIGSLLRTFLGLALLTIVFDNLIITFHIVAYSHDRLLRIYLGRIPIEDFAYPLIAAILIPALWTRQHDET